MGAAGYGNPLEQNGVSMGYDSMTIAAFTKAIQSQTG
jgi:hypothetical protein